MPTSPSLLARTVRGIEWLAADEIDGLAPRTVRLGPREVRFDLDRPTPAVTELRTVDDVFLLVAEFDGVGHTKDVVAGFADRVADQDWAGALAALRQYAPRPIGRFDVVASFIGRRNFNRFILEDAVGAALAPPLAADFVSRDAQAAQPVPIDLTVRVFLEHGDARVALRIAAGPLHRRGWKQHADRGTLHPPLAAALGRLTRPAATVTDPFCGDGTIGIELLRTFPAARMLASDLDVDRLRNARTNAHAAQVGPAFVRADAGRLPWRTGSIDAVVGNPPWNLAVDAAGSLQHGLGNLWPELGRVVRPGGRLVLLADTELGLPRELRGAGFVVALAQQLRLAGRISDLVLCGPPDGPVPELTSNQDRRRRDAQAAGVITDSGF